jgi:TRAP-type uncharacterized transport system fused permease subunit
VLPGLSAPEALPGPWEWIVSLGLVTFYLVMGWSLVQSFRRAHADGAPGGVLRRRAAGDSPVCRCPSRPLTAATTHIPWRDWVFAALASGFSLYLLVFFDGIFIQRPGQHTPVDLMFGVIAIAMVIEATRRTMGIFLPLLAVATVLYGIFGPYLPGGLAHRGYSVSRIVAHLYKGTEGIYGIPVGVVATFVFHFVLFGIMAQLTGLGQLFVNLATIAAGRFAGGPAKVSVVSSGLFGMISGSAIANTVTTGVMTIPLMKKVGFSPRFAGAVEASASCGGQITPPIMGAAAFIMAETLGIPYNQLDPGGDGAGGLLHYLAILFMVHLEAKRLKLAGMPADEIPSAVAGAQELLAPVHPAGGDGHAAADAVHALSGRLLGHHAHGGVLLDPRLLGRWGQRHDRPGDHAARAGAGLRDGRQVGTGHWRGLRLRRLRAGHHHAHRHGLQVLGLRDRPVGHGGPGAAWCWMPVQAGSTCKQVTILFGLMFTAIACIIMGSGVPTTPTYIILASIVAPALAQLGVPQLATHFFVFYYGVLADVTPPVALAAFAAAGIARSEPMGTGMTAFRLSMGKALVPFAFVYTPALLFIDFTWFSFLLATVCAVVAVMGLGAAYTGFVARPIGKLSFWLLNALSISLVFANPVVAAVAIPGVLLILLWHSRPLPQTA